MSEYKMKKKIGEGIVERDILPPRIKYLDYSGVDLDKLPRRTKVELFIEVSSERKVSCPKNIQWRDSNAIPGTYDMLSTDKDVGVIAHVYGGGDEYCLYVDGESQTHESFWKAASACEEYLADNRLFGFKWESEIEPVAWDVEWIRPETGEVMLHRWKHKQSAMREYQKRLARPTKARLWAITADLERWEVVDV